MDKTNTCQFITKQDLIFGKTLQKKRTGSTGLILFTMRDTHSWTIDGWVRDSLVVIALINNEFCVKLTKKSTLLGPSILEVILFMLHLGNVQHNG
jgi:hypothetical protein